VLLWGWGYRGKTSNRYLISCRPLLDENVRIITGSSDIIGGLYKFATGGEASFGSVPNFLSIEGNDCRVLGHQQGYFSAGDIQE